MFIEPTMGSVELLDDYDELWAKVLDDSASLVTSDSMLTAQEGWSSAQILRKEINPSGSSRKMRLYPHNQELSIRNIIN